jgi:hypothetical protein
MCTGDYASCDSDAPPQTDLQLVFSDEFEAAGQAFGVGEANPRWTAEHMWYAGTQDLEVYLPEQVGRSELLYREHRDAFEFIAATAMPGVVARRWRVCRLGPAACLPPIRPQVTTAEGAAVITIDKAGTSKASAPSQQPNGVVWNVSKDYKSGMVSSWNKFCFTGGYMETRLQLPGDDFAGGFW